MSMNAAAASPWYRSLNRSQWNTLFASNLGWLFDGYEIYALILTVGVALHQLLDPSQYGQIPLYAGTVIAITLFGWGIGGMIGGVLADYIGRRRTMMLRDPGLFADDRLERAVVELALLRAAALRGRRRHRLGMGDRRVDHRRAVARPARAAGAPG